jgi:hypothetical protein
VIRSVRESRRGIDESAIAERTRNLTEGRIVRGSGTSGVTGPGLGVEPRAAADALFASPTLVDLLVWFCREPEREFYVNELIRLTARFPRSIQLALAKLEAAGLIRSERRANARFYRVVTTHHFFPHLQAIAAHVVDLRSDLARSFDGVAGIRVAFLRPVEPGSGERELVVVGSTTPGDVRAVVEPVARRLGRGIHVQVIEPDDWRRQARRERSFVRWLLEEPREFVIGGDADLPAD